MVTRDADKKKGQMMILSVDDIVPEDHVLKKLITVLNQLVINMDKLLITQFIQEISMIVVLSKHCMTKLNFTILKRWLQMPNIKHRQLCIYL